MSDSVVDIMQQTYVLPVPVHLLGNVKQKWKCKFIQHLERKVEEMAI